MPKKYLEISVLEAAQRRLDFIFEHYTREEIYLSYSGGKDSTVMFEMALKTARKFGKLPLQVVTLDLEANFKETVRLITNVMTNPDVEPYWLCLHFGYRNAVSMFQPFWVAWNEEEKDLWVRDMPDLPFVIRPDAHPFEPFGWRERMRPSQFYAVFSRYIARKTGRAVGLIGVRSDESLNRYRVLYANKEKIGGHNWTTKMSETQEIYNVYPLYDWRVEDIWTYTAQENLDYNRIYDLMYLAGKSIHSMRICQPFGDEQKAGLDLWHAIEPETWFRVVQRVAGANGGKYYCGDRDMMGVGNIKKPEGHTWKSYYELLMKSLPTSLRLHYQRMINVTVRNWTAKGKVEGADGINPDYGDLTPGAPSYKRFCKMILENDFIGHTLKFAGRKNGYQEYDDLAALVSDAELEEIERLFGGIDPTVTKYQDLMERANAETQPSETLELPQITHHPLKEKYADI